MFYNDAPLYVAVFAAIEEITGESIPMAYDEVDDETTLESLGIFEEDVYMFTCAIAEKFGFDLNIEDSEIGEGASVHHVVNFVEENL